MNPATTPVIVSAVRTPIGRYLGGLSSFTAPQLGAMVIRDAIKRAGIDAKAVEEVIMGQVLQAGAGQIPARQAAYTDRQIEDVPEELRTKYFDRQNGSWIFRKDLRRSVIFGTHDLLGSFTPAGEVRLGGIPVVNAALNQESTASLVRLAGLSGLLGAMIAWLCFRDWRLTFLVLATGIYSAAASLAEISVAYTLSSDVGALSGVIARMISSSSGLALWRQNFQRRDRRRSRQVFMVTRVSHLAGSSSSWVAGPLKAR